MADRPLMPAGLDLARSTPVFTDRTVPPALLAAHRVASGVWGRLRMLDGKVRFVFEADTSGTYELGPGDVIDIPPEVEHHVEPQPGARFVIEFYRAPRG